MDVTLGNGIVIGDLRVDTRNPRKVRITYTGDGEDRQVLVIPPEAWKAIAREAGQRLDGIHVINCDKGEL